jgi:multiple sugar transport system substrate-binding protein
MIRRRSLLGSVAVLAAPALVSRAGAQSTFDWKRFKGQTVQVNVPKMPRSDVLQAHHKEFEELTGISVVLEQIPEQQQRPKIVLEMASGKPSFDVVYIAMHVQKKLVERGKWMEDLRPLANDPTMTAAEFDFADFGAAGLKVATGSDGKLNVLPMNQDQFILYWNKELFAEKGLQPPRTFEAFLAAGRKLNDPGKGIAGFVGRGVKNANVPLYDNMLLGWDQETITPDGRTLLTDTPAAIEAGKFFQAVMRECAPPGVVGFNWNEAQTTFMQGRAGMWWDSIGLSAPLVDPSKSRVIGKVGFLPVPAGPKGAWSAAFLEGMGIPAAAKNKGPGWYYLQWATSKKMMEEMFRTGVGTPPRSSPYRNAEIVKASAFPPEWFDTSVESLKIARSSLPEIVSVTEFRDTLGIALSNIIGGADVAKELQAATAAFAPILAKELQA